MRTLAIAMLCHAANAAYCASLGDTSQVAWDLAPDWQKDSAIKGVEFCLANPDAPASANHESWMAEKVAAGWVYGKKKDEQATPPTHPCLMSFEKLPPAQQFKDVLFKTIVTGCAGDDEQAADTSGMDGDFVAGLTAERDQALERANASDASAGQVEELKGAVDQLTSERDAAIARAEAAEAKATKAASEAKAAKATVTRGEKSTKPRKLGPIDGGLTGEDLAEALAEADADEDKVEIVISDGTKEITGIAPIAVTGDVWRDHIRGKMLRDPVKIHGPQHGDPSYAIDGYALLIDGKQVAYCKRSDPINVAPGQEISLADDIFF